MAQRGIARTFQNIRLFRALSALENIKIARHARTRAGLLAGVFGQDRAEERGVDERAWQLLDLVGLGSLAGQQAGNFSYGDQRRLEIARALATDRRCCCWTNPPPG